MKTTDLSLGDEFAGRGDPYRVAYLIASYIRGTILEHEHNELDDWVAASEDNMRLFEELTDERNQAATAGKLKRFNINAAYEELKGRLGLTAPKPPLNRNLWIGIAASVALVVSTVLLFTRYSKTTNQKNAQQVVASGTDMAPGGNYAVLTLDNGEQINLNESANGTLNTSSEVQIEKPADGSIRYLPLSKNTGSYNVYNTLSTPTGGQHKVVLSDGTVVWLNAASSLKYPVSFNAENRWVDLKGEAYFEVAPALLADGKNKKSFLVNCEGLEVEVVGTHFNVSAYGSDDFASATLLEGKVNVKLPGRNENTTSLLPGQQVIVKRSEITLNNRADTASAVAWKNGMFVFRDADIQTIMRNVERWYNAKVVYTSEVHGHFNATVERNVPVSKLLHYLQLTGHVAFTVRNDTIYVQNQP